MKILWCVTGAGHLLRDCAKLVESIAKRHEIDLAYSDAGFQVANIYGVTDSLNKAGRHVFFNKDQGPSSPLCAKVGTKTYDCVVIAPASANTVAKLRYGISDSLVTNVASQALKSRVKLYILPTDTSSSVQTELPSGKKTTIYPRPIDIKNAKGLGRQSGIGLASTPKELEAQFC
ncbi:MAG: flavoprotein [Candidatus Altiarchaeota archaeon]